MPSFASELTIPFSNAVLHYSEELADRKELRHVRPGCRSFFFQAEDGIRYLTVTGVQTCALPIWMGHVPVFGHDQRHLQLVPHADLEVAGIVGGGHLDESRPEIADHALVPDDGNLEPHDRQADLLPEIGAAARVVRVHRHRRVARS